MLSGCTAIESSHKLILDFFVGCCKEREVVGFLRLLPFLERIQVGCLPEIRTDVLMDPIQHMFRFDVKIYSQTFELLDQKHAK